MSWSSSSRLLRLPLSTSGSTIIEMPITEMVGRILFDGLDPRMAIRELMARPAASEGLREV